ncbi:uncharacterized protein LOC131023627 [Salvia miltiorrhiza]|uniref:uncharacterized protein LOC131023627 n=1 Tax=Salvia miltiorrhiza TaxID=226208 RepID=UPI0025ABF501|nr:uncharacterized protein LOC131023627 [Salvia miltiorrhiza]
MPRGKKSSARMVNKERPNDDTGERLEEFYNILADKVADCILKNRRKDVSNSTRKENDGPSNEQNGTDDAEVNASTIIAECMEATSAKKKGKEKANASLEDTLLNEERVINARNRVVRKINEALCSNDDDFVEEGLNEKNTENVGPKDTVQKEGNIHPMLRSRGSPSHLHKLISSLNDTQKEAVKHIGFGGLLHLQINELPTKLAYWVIKSFDRKELMIQLCNGKFIKVTEEDVQRVFGFPRGPNLIESVEAKQKHTLKDQWLSFFPNSKKGNITASELERVALECVDGGDWFKRHFLILVAHTLVEYRGHGYVVPLIIKCVEDLMTLHKWNWCEYVIRSLVDARDKWDANHLKMFVGPVLFPLVLYLDRTKVGNIMHGRQLPSITNWDYKSMKAREDVEGRSKRGFGHGELLDPIELHFGGKMNDVEAENTTNVDTDELVDIAVDQENFGKQLMRKLHKLVLIRKEMESMIELTKTVDVVDNGLKKAITEAMMELGLQDMSSPPTNAMDNTQFWNEVIDASIEVESTYEKRRERMVDLSDGPTFDLGISQMGMDTGDQREEMQTEEVGIEKDKCVGHSDDGQIEIYDHVQKKDNVVVALPRRSKRKMVKNK